MYRRSYIGETFTKFNGPGMGSMFGDHVCPHCSYMMGLAAMNAVVQA